MSACESCWTRSHVISRQTGYAQVEVYRALVAANPEHPGAGGPTTYTPLTAVEASTLRAQLTAVTPTTTDT